MRFHLSGSLFVIVSYCIVSYLVLHFSLEALRIFFKNDSIELSLNYSQ